MCFSVVLHNNQRHIGTCVCVVCFGVYFLLVFYEQQRDRSLGVGFVYVCDLFIGGIGSYLYQLFFSFLFICLVLA